MRSYRVLARQLPSLLRRRFRPGGGNGMIMPVRLEPLECRRLMAAGFLDTSFDGDGRVVRGDTGTARAVVVLADGRIVTAGSVAAGPGGSDFFLARYNTDGSPDTTFGDGLGAGGTVRTDFAGRSDAAAALLVQADGKIVAVGSSGREFAAARYNSDGSLDATFGPGGADGDGRVSFGFGGAGSAALDVALQDDQRLVLSGSASPAAGDSDFALARLNPDGSLDQTFGAGGMVTTGHGLTAAYGVDVGPGGKIVAGGTAEGGDGDAGLARYNPDGSLDASFGPLPEGEGAPPAGIVRGGLDAVADYDEIADVYVEPSGDILVAGHIATRGFMVARVDGFDGLFTRKFDPADVYSSGGVGGAFARSLAVQGDGRIVAAGHTTDDEGNVENFAVVRYNPDGTVDTTFALKGVAVTDMRQSSQETRDAAYGVAISPVDGAIVAAGTGGQAGGGVVARYRGRPDTLAAPVALIPGVALYVIGGNGPDDVRLRPASVQGAVPGTEVSAVAADLNGSIVMVRTAEAPKVLVSGGGGDDSIRAMPGAGGALLNVPMDVDGGSGGDWILGGASNDMLRGGDGNDIIDGGRGADAILGGRGDDDLRASEGDGAPAGPFADDYYSGGPGTDRIDYSARTAGVNVRLGGIGTGWAGERDRVREDIEGAVGGSGNDRIEGNQRPNTIHGGGGNDILIGRGGIDTLLGQNGDDVLIDRDGGVNTLDGGPGFDTVNGVREQPVQVTLEAEDAALVGASVGRSNGGYTGTGYADYNRAGGDAVEWTYNGTSAGQRTLTFRYANGSSADRPLELRVNGAVIVPSLSFASTGSWGTWRTVTVTVQLAEGANRIRLTSIGSNGPNLDSVRIS